MTDLVSNAASDARPSMTVTGVGQATINQGKIDLTDILVTADTVALCKLPAGHVPIDFTLVSDDLDTAAALLMEVGIIGGADSGALVASNTLGQAGGMARMDNAAGFDIAPADVDRLIGVTVLTGATGAIAGKLEGILFSRPVNSDD